MNCKQGDLAIIVKSVAGNEGKIVRCVRFAGKEQRIAPNGSIDSWDVWEIDRPIPDWMGNSLFTCMDANMVPIRDPGDDAVDETLLRLPSPRQEVTA